MFFTVLSTRTYETWMFQNFALVERSIAITYGAVPDKPAIHRTDTHEWCVGDLALPDLIITRVSMSDILNEPIHF